MGNKSDSSKGNGGTEEAAAAASKKPNNKKDVDVVLEPSKGSKKEGNNSTGENNKEETIEIGTQLSVSTNSLKEIVGPLQTLKKKRSQTASIRTTNTVFFVCLDFPEQNHTYSTDNLRRSFYTLQTLLLPIF